MSVCLSICRSICHSLLLLVPPVFFECLVIIDFKNEKWFIAKHLVIAIPFQIGPETLPFSLQNLMTFWFNVENFEQKFRFESGANVLIARVTRCAMKYMYVSVGACDWKRL